MNKQQEYKWDVDRQCWHDPIPAGYKPWDGPGSDMTFVRTIEPSSILDEWAEIYVQKSSVEAWLDSAQAEISPEDYTYHQISEALQQAKGE